MKREQLEHIVRAAAAITGAHEFIVIGSQAIHGTVRSPQPELITSVEADILSTRSDDDAALVDGSIGELSPFHQTFGYYAHGLTSAAATLPAGWRDRLLPLRSPNTGGATALCLEIHDLFVSKLAAGREKDLAYLELLLECGLVEQSTIETRLTETELNETEQKTLRNRLQRLMKTRSK